MIRDGEQRTKTMRNGAGDRRFGTRTATFKLGSSLSQVTCLSWSTSAAVFSRDRRDRAHRDDEVESLKGFDGGLVFDPVWLFCCRCRCRVRDAYEVRYSLDVLQRHGAERVIFRPLQRRVRRRRRKVPLCMRSRSERRPSRPSRSPKRRRRSSFRQPQHDEGSEREAADLQGGERGRLLFNLAGQAVDGGRDLLGSSVSPLRTMATTGPDSGSIHLQRLRGTGGDLQHAVPRAVRLPAEIR